MLNCKKQRIDGRRLEEIKGFLPDYLLKELIINDSIQGVMLKNTPQKILNGLDYLSPGEKSLVKISLDLCCGDPRLPTVSSILDLWCINKDCRDKILKIFSP